MARRERRETTSGSLIGSGIVIAILTGMLAGMAGFDDGDAGVVVALVGGALAQILLLVGCIAKGVAIGNRESGQAND